MSLPSPIVAVMQPYFLPYIGYFALIRSVDTFVFFDTAQHIRRGWVNRNRLPLGPADDPESESTYIRVPVQHAARETAIGAMRIHEGEAWREPLKRTLTQHYGKAPHFGALLEVLEPIWRPGSDELSPLLIDLTQRIAAYLEIQRTWRLSSEFEEPLEPLPAQERIFRIAKELGAKSYINPVGGKELYDAAAFRARGMELRFLPKVPFGEWRGKFPQIGPWSIAHAIAMNDRETLRSALDSIAAGIA